MNPNTGHLVRDIDRVPAAERGEYVSIPEAKRAEAERELAGRDETMVDLRAASPLSAWAREQRASRRRMQKESRRRNRGR